MSKGTLKGLGLVFASLLIGAVIIALSNAAQAEDKALNCTSTSSDTTIVTQCNDGTVTIVNQSTNTVLVCNSAKSSDGTPKCVTHNMSKSN